MARPYRGYGRSFRPSSLRPVTSTCDGQRGYRCIVDQGSDGLCILANYSEQFLLSDEEREILARVCIEHAADRIPVIVAASHYSTRIVSERCRRAAELGASMMMLMPPYHGAGLRGTEDQTREQFARASEAALPIMLGCAALRRELSVRFWSRPPARSRRWRTSRSRRPGGGEAFVR